MPLSPEDIQRYSRQLRFEHLGLQGQQRLRGSRVTVLGCGAVGSVIAEILVRGGVGAVRLIDRDFVDQSNLPRQSLFDEQDVARVVPKAVTAARKLQQINSACRVEPVVAHITAHNIEQLTDGVDLILDGTDNFQTRFLLNDAALKHGRPWIFGSALAAQGMMMVVRPGLTPCLRCVLGDVPPQDSIPSCDQAGVLASTVHTVGALECVEALKFLTGQLDSLEKRLVDFDLWAGRFDYRGIDALRGKGHCPTCEQGRFDYLDGALEPPLQLAGRDGVHVLPPEEAGPLDLEALAAAAARRTAKPAVVANEYLVRFQVGDLKVTAFADGRAIVQGTTDLEAARRVYDQHIAVAR
ncbi:MAG: thiazole biosynthesis adenylyltransferase ThiF [Anaerolineaceae bacterium]|nr:thiazole biosynthesis adenylyltransferase ThiF [Anaerolineaceae bacterium]